MHNKTRPASIYQRIVEFIDAGEPFAVALVLNAAEGSTPQKAGVRAVIDGTGKIWGTIGGGFVEGQAQEYAVDACKSGKPVLFDFDLANAYSRDAGAICGGYMRILVDPTAAKDRDFYARAAEAIRQRRRGVAITTVRTGTATEVTTEWFAAESIPADAPFPGSDKIRASLANEKPQLFVEPRGGADVCRGRPFDSAQGRPALEPRAGCPRHAGGASPTLQVLVEPVIPKPLLVIAGGGHVGQALALQASLVGFDVTVVDDRAEFTDAALFPDGTTTLCGDIPKHVAGLSTGYDTYVVVVTRGHKLDAETLEACIHASVAYVGMIGSKRKVALLRENFIGGKLATEEEFDRVFSPIGLDIGAVTVPEIAASITAELIAVRRRGITHKPSISVEKP